MSHKILILFLFIISFSASGNEKKLPLYELGVASVLVYGADYPASNEVSPRYVIVPTFAYRGENIRNDRRGSRARFFRGKNWLIDLGTGISLPINSDNNKARKGMEDLGFIFELGPRLIYTIFETDEHSLIFLLPYRFAIATDFSFTKDNGTRANPEIEYTRALGKKMRIRLGIETSYASEKYNDYIYEVDGGDATVERPRFDAQEGYLGSSLTAALVYHGTRFSAFAGVSYNRYDNSANTDSPLYKINEGTGVAFGFNYFFYKSDERGEKAAGME